MLKQKYDEGKNLTDIGEFLQSWAPEPHKDKPMPRGMVHALLGIAPTNQNWTLADLTNCIFRNTEATDEVEDLVQKLNNMGNSEDYKANTPTEETLRAGISHSRIFPKMRTRHETRRDWLSEEELWLAIPDGGRARQCLTHAPMKSWKLIVEFIMALKKDIGSWIRNLERRDMMLLASMAENLFGFAGTHAIKNKPA